MGSAADRLLAKSQQPAKESATSTSVHNGVLQAKDAADIAEAELKKTAADLKRKVLEKGYQTFEDGLADIEKRKQELNKLLDTARQQESDITEELETIQQDKQKIANAYQVLKQKEEQVNLKLAQALKSEQEVETHQNNHLALREELITLAVYHKVNIVPCRKALLAMSRAIYQWAETLQDSHPDFIPLYNYIGKVMGVIDKYLDNTNIPDETVFPSKPKN